MMIRDGEEGYEFSYSIIVSRYSWWIDESWRGYSRRRKLEDCFKGGNREKRSGLIATYSRGGILFSSGEL